MSPAVEDTRGVEAVIGAVRGDTTGGERPIAPWIVAVTFALAAVDLIIGAWGTFFPRSFYGGFPGGPMHWVDPLGPYDAHLVTDVGESYLMMAVLLALAVRFGGRRTLQIALVTVLVQAVPHAIFHLTHLGNFSFANGLGVSLSVLGGLVVPLILLAATLRAHPGGAVTSIKRR